MIEDRDYMREPDYREPVFRRHPWTWILIGLYAVVFLAELVAGRSPAANAFFFEKLALSKNGIAHGYVWQFVTYQFMHAGMLHLLLNCWAMFLFGRELELVLGARRYLALVLSSGIVGGVFQVSVAVLWPALFGGWVVGASAGVFGLVAAYATMFPDREWRMFFIPVTMRAKTLLIFSVVIAAAGIVFPVDNTANAAHLGGMAMGWFYAAKIVPRFLRTATEVETEPEDPDSTQFTTREVDAILDKISAKGIKSLTNEERAILEAARKKMSRA
jgi:membrane associated rhomboid family serine protease